MLTRTARVGGDLIYGDEKPVVAPGAQVAGEQREFDQSDIGKELGPVAAGVRHAGAARLRALDARDRPDRAVAVPAGRRRAARPGRRSRRRRDRLGHPAVHGPADPRVAAAGHGDRHPARRLPAARPAAALRDRPRHQPVAAGTQDRRGAEQALGFVPRRLGDPQCRRADPVRRRPGRNRRDGVRPRRAGRRRLAVAQRRPSPRHRRPRCRPGPRPAAHRCRRRRPADRA